MVGTAISDIMLQYRHTVVQDIQTRVLNASVSTNSRIKGPFSRHIEQPVAPLEVKAHWNKPKIEVEHGQVELSAEVDGGARQVATGRILTLDGEVSVKQNLAYAVDEQGRPYTSVAPPGPQALQMHKLRVTYEGSHWPGLLAWLNPAKEATVLRPVIAMQLFGRLARIPLTYMPASLPLAVPTRKRTTTPTLPIVGTLTGVVDKPELVALGLMLDKTRVPSSTLGSLFPEHAPYNAAIGISTAGLNTLLTHLCQQEQAMGQFQHSRLGQTHWQWLTLTVILLNRKIRIEGTLLVQGVRMWIQAELQCWLDDKGIIRCRLLVSNVDILVAETLLTSWTELLKTLLCTPTPATQKQNTNAQSAEPLTQVFDIPTTTQTVEAVAQELLVTNGQLIVYYTIPMSLKMLPLEVSPPKPSVTIVQPHIPHQLHQGALVTAKVEARITKDSVRPYDYAWTTGLSQKLEHGSKLTIQTIPPPVPHGGQQQLTTAHLKLIDMFGQVSEVQAPVQYIASTSTEQAALARSRRRRLVIVLATGALTLLAGSGTAIAFRQLSSPPPNDPDCSSDQIKCNGTCVKNDSPNCGQCGHRCEPGTSCVNGHCVCPSGQTKCKDGCVDTNSDSNNCGNCGNVCPSGQTCSHGTCTCFSGQSDCGGTCTNPKSDSNNCGKCGNICPTGTTCVDGKCEPQPCPSGQAICSGNCTPLQDDRNNCGSCGNICPSGQTCLHGTCCSTCNGVCTDVNSDRNNCGSCGHACPSGQSCVNGTCCSACNGVCMDINSDRNNCGRCGHVCPAGQSCVDGICCPACNGVCVDMRTDPNNCGRCGNICPAGQSCVNGTCCSACNGVCVDVNTDRNNCGRCGNACPAGQSCVKGNCCSACNGVCVDVNTDPNNCGRCGNVCESGKTCVKGNCCSACSSVCVNMSSDPNNCGRCGNVCGSGTACINGTCCPSCSGVCVDTSKDPNNCGRCGNTCPSGTTCCNGVCVNTSGDASNCGSCGNVCSQGNSCVNGKCCFACNGVCVNTSNDPKNCGLCGSVCGPGTTCINGTCCPSCNGVCVDTGSDPHNCGQCGNICPSGTSCCNGVCINTSSDTSNCGSCGNVCPQGNSCINGKCCPSCNGTVCVDTSSDPNNCGGCGKVCGSGQFCSGGQCVCSNGGTRCGETPCCGSGSSCVSETCCPLNLVCGNTCCPSDYYCAQCRLSSGQSCGEACCPLGTVLVLGGDGHLWCTLEPG